MGGADMSELVDDVEEILKESSAVRHANTAAMDAIDKSHAALVSINHILTTLVAPGQVIIPADYAVLSSAVSDALKVLSKCSRN
jgi:hypothetical protein